jgi:hypothetical protein
LPRNTRYACSLEQIPLRYRQHETQNRSLAARRSLRDIFVHLNFGPILRSRAPTHGRSNARRIGIILALIPIRRGERWAMFTSFVTFAILFVTRMATDPRCLVVLDSHQHGCHTFIIAIILGVAGLILTSVGS